MVVWAGIVVAIGLSWMHWGNDRIELGGKAHAAELAFVEVDAGFRYGLPIDPARIARYYKKLSNDLGEFFIYMYKYKEGFYAGADIGGQLFELAEVGYGTNPELIEMNESMLFGVPSIRVRGYCGMACPTADYITVKDGYPHVWLHVDGGVQEYDLDNDGLKDLITTAGRPLETHIYMMKDGMLKRASVNEALLSRSVSFFQDGRFIAYEPNSALTHSFRFQDGELVSK